MADPDSLALLRVLVEAHAKPYEGTGSREPIMFLKHMGGAAFQHHALEEAPEADEALVEELHDQGLVDIDYRDHSFNITPTAHGRKVVEAHTRVLNPEPVADLKSVLDAIAAQAKAENKLSWTAVRPVLAALRSYWEAGGFSPHGIQLAAVITATPEEHEDLTIATIRALTAGDYLRETTDLAINDLPAEVELTERAHTVLDGWPGAAPDELAENLLAVLTAAVASERDPHRKRRLERVIETVRELGVSTAGEVLAKVLLGT